MQVYLVADVNPLKACSQAILGIGYGMILQVVCQHTSIPLAAGRGVTDASLLQSLARSLWGFAESSEADEKVLSLVETAGGPASPGPSGSLQVSFRRMYVRVCVI